MSSDAATEPDPPDGFHHVGSVAALREESPTQVTVDGHSVGLVVADGEVHAIDNRCPHMGFPLSEGTVEDGILTCHWHHARFELSCGDTLDPFADDVGTYPVTVRDGEVFVDPTPERDRPPAEHWRDRLDHGLRENLGLVIAKSVIGLDDAGVPPADPIEQAVAFGTHYRESGWGSGLTTLGVMAGLLDALRPQDRRRALSVGCRAVADDCAGEPPFFVQDPLDATDVPADRLTAWFRDTIDVRDADGAERVLRTAIGADLPRSAIVGMLVAAATDHRYLDAGHRVDFLNKACELLDRIGWDQADRVLPSLVPALATADRAEEDATWRQPIDVAALVADAAAELPATVPRDGDWTPPDGIVETLLSDDPHAIVDTLTGAIEVGATPADLAACVTNAAAHRIARFGTANEFRDWNTVHHTYTYAVAVEGLAARTDVPETYRAVLDGAMSVYLDRFLNVPPASVPDPSDTDRAPAAIREELCETFEVERDAEVNRAGRLVSEYVDAGGDVAELKADLGSALLREDVGFHARQNLEAAFTAYDRRSEGGDGVGTLPAGGSIAGDGGTRIHLIAAARYLAAHTPTRRSGEQTFRIAARLHRGEKIHEGAE